MVGRTLDDYTFGSEFLHDDGTYLGCHALLYLKSAGVEVDKPCQFAQSDSLAVGDISYRDVAEEGEDVMLAQGVKLDVFNYDHIRAFVREDGSVDNCIGVLSIPPGDIRHGFGGTHRGLDQALALKIFAQQTYDGLIVGGYFLDGVVREIRCTHGWDDDMEWSRLGQMGSRSMVDGFSRR